MSSAKQNREIFDKLENSGIKSNQELFNFALNNDKDSVLEFVSSTANNENIDYILNNVQNEDILLSLYQNPNIDIDQQQELTQKVDTTVVVFNNLEKTPDKEKLHSLITNEKDGALAFAQRCKNEKLFDMFPKNDEFSIALSKNENLTPKTINELAKYANSIDKEAPENKQKVKEQILENLSNNKSVPKEKREEIKTDISRFVNMVYQGDETLQTFKHSYDSVKSKSVSLSALMDGFKKKLNQTAKKDKNLSLKRER